jgi:hypothetical protein
MWYFLTLYMQHVLGFGALRTGMGFLPHTVLMLIVGLWMTPWLMRYVSSRTLVMVGAVVAAAGFWWQCQITVDSSYRWGVLGPAIVLSVGGGLLTTPLTAIVTSGVPAADAGAASGLMNTGKQIGGALGLAALLAATTHTSTHPDAVLTGYTDAFAITAVVLVVVAALALALPARRDGSAD